MNPSNSNFLHLFVFASPLVTVAVQVVFFIIDKVLSRRDKQETKTIASAAKYGDKLCDSFKKLYAIEENHTKEIAELRNELKSATGKEFDTLAVQQIKINARGKVKGLNETKIVEPNEVDGFRETFARLEKIAE